jgi:phage terminase large subunit-like protein
MLAFIRYVWWMPGPFFEGRHTIAICAALDRAVEKYLAGQSSFLDISVPFRHGKSDIVSRAFPAYFLGRCADQQPDVIMSGYGAELVESFSRDTKRIIQSDAYRRLFPASLLARGANNLAAWSMAGSSGKVTVAGLGGALTGKGGSLLILDDYCKTRAEAVSQRYRDRTWESFRTDFLTRRAPASIVIVCATPWHVDDIRGRMRKAEAENADFPRFEQLRFPARDNDGAFLFLERFPESWYREQYATLGKLAAGLLDCSPTLEGGNRFDTAKVKFHASPEDFPKVRYIRAWDLASSAKERDKDDPDWTVGELGTVTMENRVPHLWIRDVAYIQAEAPRRDALMQATARADGLGVPQYVEAFGGYKDAYTTLKSVLTGISVVMPAHLPGDKSAKLAPLEPIFDAGNVHLLRAPWNEAFLRQFTEFPDGAHDDFCDPAAILYHMLVKGGSGLL